MRKSTSPQDRSESGRPYRRATGLRGWIDAPSVAIVAMGLALWAVWPDGRNVGPRRKLTRTRVIYRSAGLGFVPDHRSPTIISLSETERFTPHPDGEPDSRLLGRSPEARLLERLPRPGWEGHPALGQPPALSAEEVLRRDTATPAVFGRTVAKQPRLFVQASPGLARRGFAAPEFGPQWLAENRPTWEIKVSLQFSPDGRVEHVFMEEACAEDEVNATVVRKLYEATVNGGDQPLLGYVTVGYGMQPTLEPGTEEGNP